MEQFNITNEDMIEGMKRKRSESIENELKFMVSFLRESQKAFLKKESKESGLDMLQELVYENIISATMFSKLLPIIKDPYLPYELNFID